MIEEGEKAPMFDLPGVRDGEITQVAGGEFLGENIVVLAFYPGDFNPACEGSETGLDELDLFTMQKDVDVLALSGDSVYSHLAFADEYSLHMPLLTDIDGSVAEAYGVAVEDETAGYRTKRAVVVVDHAGIVQYTWLGETPGAIPNAETIRDAINEIGDEDTAQSRYRVGYARYMEGRRAFTSAMKAFEQDEWMIAQADFTQAADEFDEAGDEFNTAIRFAEGETTRTYFERAEKKAEALWRAADWLSQSAKAFSSGEGARGQSLRSDAESPLETARDLHDPPDPDDFPPAEDPVEESEETEQQFLPDDEEKPAASLDADLDAAVQAEASAEADPSVSAVPAYGNSKPLRTRSSATTDPSARPRSYPDQDRQLEPTGESQAESEASDDEPADTESEIDDEELEAITAELEEQSEAAPDLSEPDPTDGTVVPDAIDPSSLANEDLSEEGELQLESTDSADAADQAGDTDHEQADQSTPATEDESGEDAAPVAEDSPDSADAEPTADGDEEQTDSTSTEDDDTEDESVVDDVYTGVVDVSSDVIEQVGGEMVDLDDEETTAESDEGDTEQGDGERQTDDVELDLSEPDTDEEDDEEETDVSTGDHGVPDSL